MNKALARIDSTFLGVEDHGIFTAMIQVSYEGGSGQGVGGYCLDESRRGVDDTFKGRFGTAQGMQFVMNTIRAAGVEKWEDLKGRMIYVLKKDEWDSEVVGIQGLGFGKESEPFIFKALWPERVVS